MKKISALRITLATVIVAMCAGTVTAAVTGISYLYGNGKTAPSTTLAGYLATADGGAVNVMNSPAPTVVGQALRISAIGTAPAATWQNLPDGGVSGSGTTGYLPIWTGTGTGTSATLGNSTLWESGTTMYRQITGSSNLLRWELYSSNSGYTPYFQLRRSLSNTLGTLATTTNGINLGGLLFYGANTTPAFSFGAGILATQVGAAGAYVPAKLCLWTYSSSTANTAQECLNPDNSVTFSGPISAASYPNIAIAFKSTDSSVGIATNTNMTANVDLQVKGKVPATAQVAAGDGLQSGGALGTGTGITVAVNSSVVRYAGSGTADPSQSPCVAAPQMSVYYQLLHSTDGGASYGLWWKSGSGDCGWTEFGTGGSGGGGGLTLISPNGTLNIGAGGGNTTADVVYGTTANTAAQGNDSRITGAEQTANKGVGGGYTPLGTDTMVSVSYLHPATESVAGTLSGPDKTKLDGITDGATPDTYEVRASGGTTPGYLDAVCESTDSSITIGQTGNYLTFDANFGTSASQVCSGATCAGLQSQLPACAAGQVEQFGTVTRTGTNTSTTTTRTCRNSPWQEAGSYQPTLLPGTNGQVLAISATDTNTTRNWQPANLVATQARIGAASGTASSTDTQAMPAGAKVARSTSARISTTTSTATASSTAIDVLGSDAQVILPVASTSSAGIVQLASNARISTTTSTATASSGVTTAMPSDAVVVIPIATKNAPGVVQLASADGAMPTLPGCRNGQIWMGSSSTQTDTITSTSTAMGCENPPWSTGGGVSLSTSGGVSIAGGTATSSGTATTAAPAGHVHPFGDGTPTPTLLPFAGTSTSTSTVTTSIIHWRQAQESDVSGLTADLGAKQTSLGTAYQGYMLYAGGTATGTGTGTAVWAPRPTLSLGSDNVHKVLMLGTDTATGTNSVTSTSTEWVYLAEGHVQNLLSDLYGKVSTTSTTTSPTASMIPVADGSGKLNAWVSHQVRGFYAAGLTTTVQTIADTWTTFLSVSTSGQGAGTVVANGALGLTTTSLPGSCDARIVLDAAAQIGGAVKGDAGSSSDIALSPIFIGTLSTGAHTVSLQVLDHSGVTCQAMIGYQSENFGSLIVTEYTN